jgi:hypothetical protein
MKIVDKELYLGAALAQIVESSGFECIRKASLAFGHYELNGCRRILIRHTAAEGGPWYFTFRSRDLRPVRDDLSAGRELFLCLVCESEAICVLSAEQLRQIVDLDSEETQSVRVYSRAGGSIHVSGSAGELSEKVLKHAFPSRLFR